MKKRTIVKSNFSKSISIADAIEKMHDAKSFLFTMGFITSKQNDEISIRANLWKKWREK